jgi:Fic family protein
MYLLSEQQQKIMYDMLSKTPKKLTIKEISSTTLLPQTTVSAVLHKLA